MPRRPPAIVLFSLVFLLSPLFILVQAAWLNRLPLLGYYNVFSRLFITDIAVLALYLVCAVSIYLVKKSSWYIRMIQ